MVAPVAHLAPSHGGSACSAAKHHNRGVCQYSCLPPTYLLISTNWLIWLTSTIIMLTKVCAVSENWVDGPGTEEQVLLELKIGHKVMSPKYCPQSYCARDFSIKGKLWKHFLGLFHPQTQRHLGSIGRTQVGWKYSLDCFTIIAFDRFEGRQTGFSSCLLEASEADSLQFRVWKKTNNWVRFWLLLQKRRLKQFMFPNT